MIVDLYSHGTGKPLHQNWDIKRMPELGELVGFPLHPDGMAAWVVEDVFTEYDPPRVYLNAGWREISARRKGGEKRG